MGRLEDHILQNCQAQNSVSLEGQTVDNWVVEKLRHQEIGKLKKAAKVVTEWRKLARRETQ